MPITGGISATFSKARDVLPTGYTPRIPLATGTRIGPYEILSTLGAGGMGEVYRARDAKLNRDVAIKVLLPSVANDPDRLERFSREAQVLASLNHPNIAHIHGIEESNGITALVMELVEGEDLSQRTARGPIPIDDALPIARQIAEALEAAHEQGIIHRDLKPANIKLRADGTVKVLDFGLAKAIAPAGTSSANAMNSPTLSMHATEAGIILGTAAYMSPEQAAGKVVDQRTDLWAFGVVLMEMLTGRRVFDGETVSHVLAAVLKDDPDWTALPPNTPASIRRLLRRSLEKDRKRRIADAADARLEIDDALSAPTVGARDGSSVAVLVSRPAWRRALPGVAVALVALGAGTALTWLAMRASSAPPAVVRVTMAPRPGEVVGTTSLDSDLVLSLDGRQLVYVGTADAQTQLYVRALDRLEPTPLRGLTNPRGPFLSPDGAWVGFFEGIQALKKVAITGGPALTVCPITAPPRGASWGSHGTVIFATSAPDTGLLEVSGGGGEPRVLTTPDTAKGEVDHLFPEILPGGEAVLFTIVTTGPIENSQIALLDLRTGQSRVLVAGGSNPHYAASGHLVYGVGGALRAVAFDLERLQVRGTPVPVVDRVVMKGTGAASFSLGNGSLVYLAGDQQAVARTLVWVDRQGREHPIPATPRNYFFPRLSPDGRRVALDVRDQENDIWTWAFEGQTLTRLTFDPSVDMYPVWTPNGARVVYSSGSPPTLFWRAGDGTGGAEQLADAPMEMIGHSFSPDGTRLVVRQANPTTGFDLYLLSLTGETGRGTTRDARPLVATPSNELNAEVSPDGAWMAYQSNASGTDEIYVQPFPAMEQGRWQVSTNGGTTPLWARSGRELFYRAPDGRLMAVPILPGPSFTRGNAAVVVDRAYFTGGSLGRSYDVSPDGTRFLMIKDVAASTATAPQLVVVLNFFEELKRLVPAR